MALTVLIKPASGKCNLRCRYCFYADEAENRAVGDYGFMSAETAENVVRRAFETGEREYIFAFQGGEPMLAGLSFYEAFVRRVGEYNKKRAKVHYTIQTNGTLIDGAFAKFFKRSGFLVGVSLDGDAAVHDADRLTADGRGSFARVEEGIRRLEEAGADFNIVSVVNKKNYKKIGQTYRFFREKGFRWLQFIPCVDTVRSGSPFMLRSGQMARYLCELFDLWFEDLLHGGRVSVRNFDNYLSILRGQQPENCAMCGVCGNYFTVEADGSVFPCDFYCMDEWLLGNVNESPFSAMRGALAEKFVEESKEVPKACAGCRYFFLCRNGCKKDRVQGRNRYCAAYRKFFARKERQLLFLAQRTR